MNEVRYHPIVSDEGEMVPLFFTYDKCAVSQNDYYLEEIVPHYYRLISKAAMPERTVCSFRIHCPVCGSHLKPIASGVDLADNFTKIAVGKHKLAALFRISSEFVSDAAFDFESYLVKRLSQVFARTEDNAFITGTGDGEPIGILHATQGAETGASTAEITYDDVISLYFSVDAKYRKNAVWLMNDTTAMALRKLKDDAGNYLWNNADGTILGKPVVISEYMPDVGTGAKPIAFGDFSYYWIVKRRPVTVKMLTELFAARSQLGYLAFEFIDGKLIRRDAVKVLSVTATA